MTTTSPSTHTDEIQEMTVATVKVKVDRVGSLKYSAI